MTDSNDNLVQHWGTRWLIDWKGEACRWMMVSMVLGTLYILDGSGKMNFLVVLLFTMNLVFSSIVLLHCWKARPKDFRTIIPTVSITYQRHGPMIRVIRDGKCTYEGTLDDAPDDVVKGYNWVMQQDKKARDCGKESL